MTEYFMRSFPAVLSGDARVYALGKVIAEALSVLYKNTDLARIYTRIDALPEFLLDALAYDFKVDWWGSDYSIEEKRLTLKESWLVHRTLGTKYAVERAVSAVCPESKVSEWFEYGGEPYHFQIHLNTTESVDEKKLAYLIDQIKYYKNTRSWLDNIGYSFAVPPVCGCVGIGHAGTYKRMKVII